MLLMTAADAVKRHCQALTAQYNRMHKQLFSVRFFWEYTGMKDKRLSIDTQAIHAGYRPEEFQGAAVAPIYQTTTYLQNDQFPLLRYHRLHNSPGHERLAARLSALENTEDAVVLASGMAAIATSLIAMTAVGDHILAQGSLYGGTYHFLTKELTNAGRKVSFFHWDEAEQLSDRVTPNTKVIYCEGLSNPMIRANDFGYLVAVAKRYNILTMIDNTLPSPVNFRPAEIGLDLIIHSATKYLNGHSDVIAGSVAGSRLCIEKIRDVAKYYGGSLDSHGLALLERGLKTLPLRVRAQNMTAQYLATELERHPRVKMVSYPGLVSHPNHIMLKKYMTGFGGMFTFEIDGTIRMAQKLLQGLQLFLPAPSLGSVESLITIPAMSSHLGLSPEERASQGISDTMVRVAVGIEAKEDLLQDLWEALGKLS